MKNNGLLPLFAVVVSILFLCGLSCAKFIKDDLVYSADEAEDASYWLDSETSTVHKMITINEKSKIVSIIRYSNGIKIEVMDVIRSEIIAGKANWAYYVPSTGYTVEMKVISSNDNEITIEWNNKDADGEVDSGEEILIRCEENGTELYPYNIDMLYDTLEDK